jgi:hypothetical protein
MADQATQQLNSIIQQFAQSLQGLVNAQSRTQAATLASMKAHADMQDHVNHELALFNDALAKNETLTKREQHALDELLKAKKREIELSIQHNNYRDKLNKLTAQGTASERDLEELRILIRNSSNKLADATLRSTKAQKDFTDATAAANTSLVNLARSGTLTSAALVWFGKTVAANARQQLAQVKASDGVIEASGNIEKALLDQQTLALKYGVSADAFINATKQGRQMFNAMGGTTQGMATLDSTVKRLVVSTGGDFQKALELATQGAKSLATAGVKPTRAALERYTDDVNRLIAQTGMSRESAMSLYDSMSQDVDMIDILRSARGSEREAILQSQRAMIQNAIAAGMSAEQAQRAAKMLNQMVAAKPIDRIKQAAKMRAMAGAMGIAGGDEAAQAVIAGKRATPEQKEALMRFNENAANKMDQMGQGSLGGEIFATTLADKLNMDQYFGKDSPFSTSIDTLKAPIAQIDATMKDVSEDQIAQTIASTAEMVKQLDLIASGQHWLGPIAAGVSSIIMLMGGGKFIGKIGEKIAGNVAGRVAGTVAGEAVGAGAAGAVGAAATGGKLAQAGKFARGVALPAAAMMATGAGVDWAAGKMGVGTARVDTDQDDKNWDRASPWEKMQSSIPRGIEKLGSLFFLDNLVNQAKSERIASETKYLDDNTKPGVVGAPVQGPGPNKVDDRVAKTAQTETSKNVEKATLTAADKLSAQVAQMDVSNDLLKKLADNADRQTDLLEKQLIALTLTDREKQNTSTKTALRGGNKFGAQYNYV